mgnify:CR=1 FL=1
MGRNGAAGVSAGGDGAATVSAGGEKAAAVSAGGEKAAAVSEGGEKVAGVSSPSLSPQRMNTAAQKADVQSGVEPVTASCASTVLACPLPFLQALMGPCPYMASTDGAMSFYGRR